MEDEFPRLGSTNWHACSEALGQLNNYFTPSYQALFHRRTASPTDPLEAQETDATLGKQHIVEFQGKLCHFSRGTLGSYRLYEWTPTGFELLDEATRDTEKYDSLRSTPAADPPSTPRQTGRA